jgi:hypothetical protein
MPMATRRGACYLEELFVFLFPSVSYVAAAVVLLSDKTDDGRTMKCETSQIHNAAH